MAHQVCPYCGQETQDCECFSEPWGRDRAPDTDTEAQLQQILWNNRIYLRDLQPLETYRLISARRSARLYIAEEFC